MPYRTQCKILLLVHRAILVVAPVIPKLKLLSFKESGSYNWRSNTSHELKVSKTKCKTLGDRAFVRVGPSPWNPFPLAIGSNRSAQGFKQALKTFLFRLAFAQWTNSCTVIAVFCFIFIFSKCTVWYVLVFVSLYYWAACRTSPVEISVFGHLRRKTYTRGSENTGSCTEKPCSHKWFRRIFPCTDPCTNIFCSSPRPETQKALQIKKAICVVRSDSIIGVTL